MSQRLTTLSISLSLLLIVAVFAQCVAEANDAPTTVGTVPKQTLKLGGAAVTIDMSSYFSDADGDTLTYTATSGDTAKVTVSVTVNMDDLVIVANAWGSVAGAPTAGTVNAWLQLAQQNVSDVVDTPTPEGFSYARGIQTLEHLARALLPETTALLANYPNPFNPETWIPYQLSKAADVSVTIYASNGNVVRTLALGHQAAGMYKNRSQATYWDGKNELGESVASGLYFYTLTAGDFTATRRMLILK